MGHFKTVYCFIELSENHIICSEAFKLNKNKRVCETHNLTPKHISQSPKLNCPERRRKNHREIAGRWANCVIGVVRAVCGSQVVTVSLLPGGQITALLRHSGDILSPVNVGTATRAIWPTPSIKLGHFL